MTPSDPRSESSAAALTGDGAGPVEPLPVPERGPRWRWRWRHANGPARITLWVALLVALANAILVARLTSGSLDLTVFQPRLRYGVELDMAMDLVGDDARVRFCLPATSDGQLVVREWVESTGPSYAIATDGAERLGTFRAEGLSGHHQVSYHAIVDVAPRSYRLEPGTRLPEHLPDEALGALAESEQIQVDHPEIRTAARDLCAGVEPGDVSAIIGRCYDFVRREVANSDYEHALDALFTLRWREAHCGGKSRLLVALLRSQGVPARMVGGLILRAGTKRTTHAWCEAWVNGEWLPMDAVNGHFLHKPAHYLTIYHGDDVLLSRSTDINFDYDFHITRYRSPPDVLMNTDHAVIEPYPALLGLEPARLPLDVVRVLLLMPLAVLVVLVARNLFGIASFGVFVPALLALAFRETGLAWGILLMLGVLVTGLLARLFIERVQLLQTPRLALVLAVVIGAIFVLSTLAVEAGIVDGHGMRMYPIVILVAIVEQGYQTLRDEGPRAGVTALLGTVAVVCLAYLLVAHPVVEAVVLVLPEVLLLVVALYLMIGRYAGLRLAELFRFRRLLRPAAVVP